MNFKLYNYIYSNNKLIFIILKLIGYKQIYLKLKIIIILLLIINLIFSINILYNPKIENESKKIENYLKICKSYKLINRKKFKKIINPKISIISPIYNREKYILRFLRSIQNQNFYDLEIILIDDYSKDKSVKKIEEYQKEDKRINLIKNSKNRGTFISRNIGAFISKGQYIILPDPDDILSNNILNICYNFMKTYNFEMIRFNIFIGNGNIFLNEIINKLEIRPIFQPELSTYLFYGSGKILQIDYNISNKFIKKEAYIRALNYLSNYYLNMYIITGEDGIMNFILYRTVKSFYYIKNIGYYYIINEQSIINNKKIPDKRFKFMFISLIIIFKYSKNNKYEKDMANEFLRTRTNKLNLKFNFSLLNDERKFYFNIINAFNNNKFITIENKLFLKKIEKIIKNKKNI